MDRPTRIEVDLGAIASNVLKLRELVAPAQLCAVVKADGYGHGIDEVALAALAAGAERLAVATVGEAKVLRTAGVEAPILLLSEPTPALAPIVLSLGCEATVYTRTFAAALNAAAQVAEVTAPIHIKADTGMGRVGAARGAWERLLDAVESWQSLTVRGLWTHLARADEPDDETTRRQLETFEIFLAMARARDIHPELVHTANSAGAIAWPGSRRDMVRVGIAMYGLSPGPEVDAAQLGLRPALRFVSALSSVKHVSAGTSVSYGHRWTAETDGHVATVPVGYADGVPRLLSNTGEVLVGGTRRPIIGSICMDQLLIWCGDDGPEAGVVPGAEVVLIGEQGQEHVRVEEWAELTGTITYEIATNFGDRRSDRTYDKQTSWL